MRIAYVLAILIPATLGACWDNNPCGPGQVVYYTQCEDAPAGDAQDSQTTTTATDTTGDPWGVTCIPTLTTDAETSVDAIDGQTPVEAGDASDVLSDADDTGDVLADVDAASDVVVDSGPPPTCYGNAPICAPQINYCTNINCAAGEANYGICPTTDGWTCYPASNGNPSACVKL